MVKKEGDRFAKFCEEHNIAVWQKNKKFVIKSTKNNERWVIEIGEEPLLTFNK